MNKCLSACWSVLGMAIVGAPCLMGCASDDGTTAPTCTSDTGTVTGTIRYGGESRGKALALIRQTAGETPLQVMADESGVYEVELDAGAWLIDGEDGAYCKTTKSSPVTVAPCGVVTVDLELDCVL